jgi:hypothetical protein
LILTILPVIYMHRFQLSFKFILFNRHCSYVHASVSPFFLQQTLLLCTCIGFNFLLNLFFNRHCSYVHALALLFILLRMIHLSCFIFSRFWLVARIGVSGVAITFSRFRKREILISLSDHSIHCYDAGMHSSKTWINQFSIQYYTYYISCWKSSFTSCEHLCLDRLNWY